MNGVKPNPLKVKQYAQSWRCALPPLATLHLAEIATTQREREGMMVIKSRVVTILIASVAVAAPPTMSVLLNFES